MENFTLIGLRKTAKYLRISDKTLFKLVHTGGIPCVKIGSVYRFDPDQLKKHFTVTPSKNGN